jgi:hypothetical protein
MKRKGKGFSEERVFEIAQGALVRWWWVKEARSTYYLYAQASATDLCDSCWEAKRRYSVFYNSGQSEPPERITSIIFYSILILFYLFWYLKSKFENQEMRR